MADVHIRLMTAGSQTEFEAESYSERKNEDFVD